MSDTPEARPGAPRPAAAGSAPRPPAPSAARITPRASAPSPSAAPPAPSTPRALPPDDDDLDELRSSAVIPAADEIKDMLPIPPAAPTPPTPPPIPRAQSSADLLDRPRPPAPRAPSYADIPDRARGAAPAGPYKSLFGPAEPPAEAKRLEPTPAPTAPLAASEPVTQPMAPPSREPITLSNQAHEQLHDILRRVLESTLAPVLAKQEELEARLEALQQQRAAASPPRQPSSASLTPVRAMAPSVDITGSLTPGSRPRPSLVMTSYGPVSVLPGPPPRPAIETALENVGPIDMPDFAGKRKFAGRVIIGLLIAGVIGAIVATVLSYS